MPTLPVHNKEGKQIDKIELSEKIFAEAVNQDVIHQAVVMYHACQRQGTASVKERGSVSGGGKKPFRQKGTGRARAGSTRSPLWAGGGVVHGPVPRDFSYTLPRKIKAAALRETINAKLQSKKLLCIDDFKEKFAKTKEFAKLLTALKLKGKILALLDGCDTSVKLVSRNIPLFEIMRSDDVNAFDILRHSNVLVTKSAMNKLLNRITKQAS